MRYIFDMRVSAEFLFSAVLAITLLVLDKAGKLTPRVLVLLVFLAALLALHAIWTLTGTDSTDPPVRSRKPLRGFALIVVCAVFVCFGFWIWPNPVAPKAPTSQVATVPPAPAPASLIAKEQEKSATADKPKPLASHRRRTEKPAAQQVATIPQPQQVTPSQPSVVNNAPNGFAISGGTVIQPQVNNYGPPPLQVTLSKLEVAGITDPATKTYHYAATIYTNRDWAPVSFRLACDGNVTDVQPSGMTNEITWEWISPVRVSWTYPPISPGAPKTLAITANTPLTKCQLWP